jgi:hypothetical protein
MSNINIIGRFSAGGEFNNIDGVFALRLTEAEQQRLTGWAAALHHLFYPKVGTDHLTSARMESPGCDHFVASSLTQDDINGEVFPDISSLLMDNDWIAVDDASYERFRHYIIKDEPHFYINPRHARWVFGPYGVVLNFVEKHVEGRIIEPNFRLDTDHETGLLLFPSPADTITLAADQSGN